MSVTHIIGFQEAMDTIKMEFVGDERWSTHSVFNSNAFPAELAPEVNTCSTKAAIHLVYLNMIKEAVKKDRKNFQKVLKLKLTKEQVASIRKNNSVPVIAYYDGEEYLAALYGFLSSLKSFLDVYSILIHKTIQPSLRQNILFNSDTVGGEKISGGAIIKWLDNSSPSTFTNSSELKRVIEDHSNNWITEAVRNRTDLVHYGDIKGIEHMQIVLNPRPGKYPGIFPPLMPNGQPVEDYCSNLLSKLREFVEESLILLPNIKMEHITFTNFLILGHRNS